MLCTTRDAGFPILSKISDVRPLNTWMKIRLFHVWPCNQHLWPKNGRLHFNDRQGADPSEWPVYLRVQQFPTVDVARLVSK